MWVSELLPCTAKMVDDMCFIRTMHTEAINHEPAITYMQTGNQITGRPCLGAWVSYGLGSLNENLPTFVVLVAKPTNTEQVQAISARLWSAVTCRANTRASRSAPAATRSYTSTIRPGVSAEVRRKTLDGLKSLNEMNYRLVGDPETHTRIQQYELAFRMQSSVPELAELADEPASTYNLYGEEAKKPGTFRPIACAGPADGRARRAVRADLPQQLGHARATSPAVCPMPVQGRGSGLLWPGAGSEAARPARRDAGHLGRRIRPHHLFARTD